jgi:hypothetical protein
LLVFAIRRCSRKKSKNMKKVRLFYNDNKGNIEKVAYIEAKWSTLRGHFYIT